MAIRSECVRDGFDTADRGHVCALSRFKSCVTVHKLEITRRTGFADVVLNERNAMGAMSPTLGRDTGKRRGKECAAERDPEHGQDAGRDRWPRGRRFSGNDERRQEEI